MDQTGDDRSPATAGHTMMKKNGRSHVLPLPPLATALIAGVRRYADTDLIFPGGRSRMTGKTAATSGWSKLWPALLAVARRHGLTGALTIHDLRKSARSHWGRLGVADRVAEVLLNHTVPNVLIKIYDQREFLDEKIAAMDLWCRAIETTLDAERRSSADVVAMPAVENRPGGAHTITG
jgi:integrase